MPDTSHSVCSDDACMHQMWHAYKRQVKLETQVNAFLELQLMQTLGEYPDVVQRISPPPACGVT